MSFRKFEGDFGEELDLPHRTIITMYHVTPLTNLPNILSEGLKKGVSKTFTSTGDWTDEYIFLEDTPNRAKEWALLEGSSATDWALLKIRVRRNDVELTGGGWATRKNIPARDIQVIERFRVKQKARDTTILRGKVRYESLRPD